MAEREETSLLFSLQELLERERQRVAHERAERRRREAEAQALAAEQERKRRAEAEAERAARERLQREQAARLDALKHAEIERARVSAQAASEAELLRVHLDRARYKTRIVGVMAASAGTALAAGVLYFLLAAEPALVAARSDAERRLDGEQQRSRKLDHELGRATERLDALAHELELLRRAKPATDVPASPPETGAPPPARAVPRQRRSDPGGKTPCVDNGDPLNPCLR